jgi:hypothetical protein
MMQHLRMGLMMRHRMMGLKAGSLTLFHLMIKLKNPWRHFLRTE